MFYSSSGFLAKIKKKNPKQSEKNENKNIFNYPEQRQCTTAQGFGQDRPFKTFSPLRDEPTLQ